MCRRDVSDTPRIKTLLFFVSVIKYRKEEEFDSQLRLIVVGKLRPQEMEADGGITASQEALRKKEARCWCSACSVLFSPGLPAHS